jgi:hypothetical protein
MTGSKVGRLPPLNEVGELDGVIRAAQRFSAGGSPISSRINS